MAHSTRNISLGFTDETFPPGVHVCQIYTDEKEREDSALKFLLSGLESGGQACCFSEKVPAEDVKLFFEAHGISYDSVVASGAFTLSGTKDVYFQEGRFDPERMLNLLKEYYTSSQASGYANARVIGEMTHEVQSIPGGEGLLA